MGKWLLRIGALGYLALLLIVPMILIGYRTFQHGASPVWNAMTSSDFEHAIYLSLLVTVIVLLMAAPISRLPKLTDDGEAVKSEMPVPVTYAIRSP